MEADDSKEGELEDSEELGRIVGDTADIVIRKTSFKGNRFIDIRKYLHTERYQGWSRKGIFLPIDKINEIIEILKKAQTGL